MPHDAVYVPSGRPIVSLFRLGLAGRLLIAVVLSAVVWTAVLWTGA